jgi:hypothetical protein
MPKSTMCWLSCQAVRAWSARLLHVRRNSLQARATHTKTSVQPRNHYTSLRLDVPKSKQSLSLTWYVCKHKPYILIIGIPIAALQVVLCDREAFCRQPLRNIQANTRCNAIIIERALPARATHLGLGRLGPGKAHFGPLPERQPSSVSLSRHVGIVGPCG